MQSSFPSKRAIPRAVQVSVEDGMQRSHFLRNRIAHNEPVHHRNLGRDLAALTDVATWLCEDTRRWIDANSRAGEVLSGRPPAV